MSNKNPWDPEITINQDFVRNLLQKQFPTLKLNAIKYIGQGWDNTVFLINHDIVFRFPHREVSGTWIENEVQVLPIIADKLSVHVPKVKYIGQPQENYPYIFAGFEWLNGTTACQLQLSAQQRLELIEPIANFIKQLHKLSSLIPENAISYELKYDRLDPNYYQERIKNILKALAQNTDKTIDYDQVEKIINDSPKIRDQNQKVLVHGDLYSRHLLLNDDHSLNGIIDWGDVHLGHPAVDLSIAFNFIPTEGLSQFQKFYGNDDEDLWKLAQFRALVSALNIYHFGIDIQDPHLIFEGLWGLHNLKVTD